MKKSKKPTKKQKLEAYLDFMGSELITISHIPEEIRFQLAHIKEHLIIYMFERFVKGEIYRLEMDGLEAENLFDVYTPSELLEQFAHFQIGYWEVVKEAENEEEDN